MEQQPPQQPPWFEQAEVQDVTVEAPRPSRWRMLAAAGTGSLALAGVVAGVALSGSGAGASAGASGQAATTTTVAGDESDADADARRAEHEAKRTERLNEVLQPLVDDGTLTTEQRDAVVQRLAEAAPERGRGHGRGPGRGGHGPRGMFGPKIEAAAEALGVTEDELRTALRGGSTIAELAEEKGVDIDTVIDALVDAAVAAQAELELPEGVTAPTEAELRERITAMVNGEGPKWGGRGHRDGEEPAAPDAPADEEPGAGSGSEDTTTTTEN